MILQWSTVRAVHHFQGNSLSKSCDIDGDLDMFDRLLPSRGLVSYFLSCQPPDDLSHNFGLAYEGAMPSTASYDITTLTDILRQLLLHRYRDCIVVLADKVC